ncbi:MAG: histidine kinase [Alistipes sp.]|jgi:two-component sensor histidine kinase|nr:histidine kinase [Alistipes sp.]MBR5483578.1 histidine kinase [Alistipes sp.]
MEIKKVTTNKPVIGENVLYLLVWGAVVLVPILNSKMMSEEHIYLVNLMTVWSKLLPYIFIFIMHNNLLVPKLLLKRRYLLYVLLSIAMLVALFYPMEYYQDSLRRLPYAGGDLYVVHGRASFTDLAWYWNVLLGVFMMGANIGIKFIFMSIQTDQRMEALEKQSLQAEMDYLKYQINPHFFMNTLNNIHALIDIDTEAAKDTVIELSKMMRYVLYDSENAATNLVSEMRFIENYIALMRIRYTDNVDVRFTVHDTVRPTAKVPPLLFIVLVENAFKHGVSYNKPSYVNIDVWCDEKQVSCQVQNSRHEQAAISKQSTKSSGMGLDNIRKRLDLLFGEEYNLAIDDSNKEQYTIKLTIPIKND